MTRSLHAVRAFFKNSSVGGGGGGIYKKGPYYTECGEMIDGLLVTKSLEVFSARKYLYFSTSMTAIPCIF